jgi:hypothetical protein
MQITLNIDSVSGIVECYTGFMVRRYVICGRWFRVYYRVYVIFNMNFTMFIWLLNLLDNLQTIQS